jgi:hypothetical protein
MDDIARPAPANSLGNPKLAYFVLVDLVDLALGAGAGAEEDALGVVPCEGGDGGGECPGCEEGFGLEVPQLL